MPLDHLLFFIEEINPIQAEESLLRIDELRVALGQNSEARKSAERKLIMAAARTDRIIKDEPDKVKKISKEEYLARLGSIGVDYMV